MKTKMLALAAITSVGLSAQAQLFNWTLTTSGSSAPGAGSGQLTLSSGVVTAMSGTVGGRTISLMGVDSFEVIGQYNNNRLPLDSGGLAINVGGLGFFKVAYDPAFFSIDYFDTGWMNVDLNYGEALFTYTAVPEPQEYAMIAGASLVGLALCRRRAQRGVRG